MEPANNNPQQTNTQETITDQTFYKNIIESIIPTESQIQQIVKVYYYSILILASNGSVLFDVDTYFWIFYNTASKNTSISNGGNYNYTNKEYITIYRSKLHGMKAMIALITTTAI